MSTKLTFRVAVSILLEFVIVTIIFGAVIISGGSFVLLENLGYEFSLEARQIVTVILIIITALIFGFFRLKQYKECETWRLDGDILKRGSPVNLMVDLSTIEKAIPGLPKSKWHEFFF